ncbi:uncharacterized protein PRCAT00002319001 [Priceomyces carsonii]|uniref:uncharacterized protein n=1 Tax=Priceomyces carsonii TaxID=28549 RepID=UPI002ED808D0|nr:unnamed protein product [Priceomyces carsonii]
MRKLFKLRRLRSNSETASNDRATSNDRRLSLPLGVHDAENERSPSNIVNNGTDARSESTLLNDSVALSDADTLLFDRKQRLELQDTYNENYTSYLPFILRQMRLGTLSDRNEDSSYSNGELRGNNRLTNNLNIPSYVNDVSSLYDDQPTITNDSLIANEATNSMIIMNRSSSSYDLRRRYVLVDEFIRNNTYMFADEEAFKLFKQLKSKKKVKTTLPQSTVDGDGSPSDYMIANRIGANRSDLIPLTYRLKGMGLPIFKIVTPYMSTFRKNSPFMVFKRYKEAPSPSKNHNSSNPEVETDIGTYDFCTVNTKHFSMFKRIILTFNPPEELEFKVLLFQCNNQPFADFIYKSTRFRVFGTSILNMSMISYNDNLKLLIIDDDKPSMCDSIINKKPGFEISSLIKKRKNSLDENGSNKNKSTEDISYDQNDPTTFPNPVPDPSNVLLQDPFSESVPSMKSFISDRSPPFGDLKDSSAYINETNLLPRRYSEIGRFDVYQDSRTLNGKNPSSTLSLDVDSLVLTCIVLTLREIALRNSPRSTNFSVGFANRLGALSMPPVQYALLL